MDKWEVTEAKGRGKSILFYNVVKGHIAHIFVFPDRDIGITEDDARKHAEMIADMLNKLEVENGS